MDRQIAEQRALREVLGDLRDAVNALVARANEPPPGVDLDAVGDRIDQSMSGVVAEVGSRIAELATTPAVAADDVRSAVAQLTGDVEGIAQALLDLNAGLRNWTQTTDGKFDTLQRSIPDAARVLQDVVATLEDRFGATEDRIGSLLESLADDDRAGDLATSVDESLKEALEDRFGALSEQLKESAELSVYLADQVEDFDRVIAQLAKLPTELEGVVAQALKRSLVAAAKLEEGASAAVEEAVASLESDLVAMRKALRELSDGTASDRIDDLVAGQEELGERIELVLSSLESRIEDLGDQMAAAQSGPGARSKPKPKSKPRSKPKPRKGRTASRRTP